MRKEASKQRSASHLATKLSDRRWPRASAEADDVVKPVTHKTETPSAGSLQRLVRHAVLHQNSMSLLSSSSLPKREHPADNPESSEAADNQRMRPPE